MEITLNKSEILLVAYHLYQAIDQQNKPDQETLDLLGKLDNLPRECNNCHKEITRTEYINGISYCYSCAKNEENNQ